MALRNHLLARSAGHIPGLKRLPIFKLLAIGEVALLARDHMSRLDPQERQRFLALMKTARGRPGNLTTVEKEEFVTLLAKMEPRMFAGMAADKFSPVPLPKFVKHGKRKPPESVN